MSPGHNKGGDFMRDSTCIYSRAMHYRRQAIAARQRAAQAFEPSSVRALFEEVANHWTALAEQVDHPAIIGGIDHGNHILVVLGRRPEHRGSADVDVLDRVLERRGGMRDRGLKGIQIDRSRRCPSIWVRARRPA